MIIPEIYADNAKLATNNTNYYVSFYNYSVTSSEPMLDGLWKIGYQIIVRANNVIHSQPLQKPASPITKQMLGEALAIRALVYFDLVRIFAQTYTIKSGVDGADGNGGQLGIPIITQVTSQDSIISPSRSTVKAVYDQVINDLLKADSLMSITPSTPCTFSNLSAEALLARVYLTKEDWNNASIYSQNVLDSKYFSLVSSSNYVAVLVTRLHFRIYFVCRNASERLQWNQRFGLYAFTVRLWRYCCFKRFRYIVYIIR